MKIGLVTACYKPVINGVTQMVSLYKQYLTELGHEVTVFTLGEPDPAGDEPNVVRSPAIPLGSTGYYFGIRYSWEAQQQLRQMDILHCHHLIMSIELAKRYASCPIVYTNHTRYDLYAGTVTSLPQPTADAMMRQFWPHLTDNCDLVIAPSDGIRKVMREFGVERPITVIENGIELDRYRQPQNSYTKADLGFAQEHILGIYVGRLSAEKRLDLLLEQLAIARRDASQLRLLIVGDGPSQEMLQRRAIELKLSDTVSFTGKVPFDDVPNYLAAADFFVTASVSEVHPLTVIEAMAAGLPIAAISSPGIEETVVDGEAGFVVDDAQELASVFVELSMSESLRQQFSREAVKASQKYDIRTTVAETEKHYQRLLARGREVPTTSQLMRLPEALSAGLRPVTQPISKFWREQYLDVLAEAKSESSSSRERHG